MTDTMRAARRLRAPAMALAAMLALSGCAGTHVVDDWQCPVAQGEVCASVAAADPAMPETLVPETLVPETLVPETRGRTNRIAATALDRAGSGGSAPEIGDRDTPGQRDCDKGCGPFAWLAGLFEGPGDAASDSADSGAVDDTAVSAATHTDGEPAAAVAPAPDVHATAKIANTEADSAVSSASAATDPVVRSLRAPEEIGRIWIAPWVDADGIYREGAWVRAVIAPAGWRLP